jgi:hypothetical protein
VAIPAGTRFASASVVKSGGAFDFGSEAFFWRTHLPLAVAQADGIIGSLGAISRKLVCRGDLSQARRFPE